MLVTLASALVFFFFFPHWEYKMAVSKFHILRVDETNYLSVFCLD